MNIKFETYLEIELDAFIECRKYLYL